MTTEKMTGITEDIAALEAAAKEAHDYTNMPMEVDPRDILELFARIQALLEERDALREALATLITWIPSADTYRRLGFDPATPMRALMEAKTVLRMKGL